MAGVAGVPPLYRQFRASARQPRWRRCPLPALEAPPALAAADANTHTRTVNVNSEKVRKTHESLKLVGETLPLKHVTESIVTESIVKTVNPVPVSARNSLHAAAADLHMLAQVEQWMAMIRQINREQQRQPAFQR